MHHNTDLTQGDIRQHLIRMTIPMIWGILAVMTVSLVDSYFVGLLGTDELAAVGFTVPVVTIMSSLAFGIGTGASALVAMAIGDHHEERIQTYTTQSILMALLVGILFATVGLFMLEPTFIMLGAPTELLPLISEYMSIWYLGAFLIVVPMVGNSAIRASGDTKLPSYVMIAVAISNAILDPIFIFGWFGVPRMELQGAAIASVLSYSIAFFIALYVLYFRLGFLSWQRCTQQISKAWKEILRLSLPATLTNLIFPISIATTTWMVAGYGSDAVAGFSVASRIENMSLIVLYALGTVIAPFMGQNFGGKHYSRMQEGSNLAFRFSWIMGITVAIILWLTAPWLVQAFTSNEAAIYAGTRYLYIVPLTYGFLGIVTLSSSIANGIGEPRPALIMSLMRLAVIYLPLAWGLSHLLELEGLFLATALANVIVGSGAWYWSHHRCRGRHETVLA